MRLVYRLKVMNATANRTPVDIHTMDLEVIDTTELCNKLQYGFYSSRTGYQYTIDNVISMERIA